jgi:hypothetical protein
MLERPAIPLVVRLYHVDVFGERAQLRQKGETYLEVFTQCLVGTPPHTAAAATEQHPRPSTCIIKRIQVTWPRSNVEVRA